MGSARDMYFLSKNYVSEYDTINVSSSDSYKTRLYDQKKELQWISSGETAETGFNTYIEIIFKENTSAVNRTYDTIVLQNINLKKFKLQNYTGGAYVDIAGASFTVNADSTVRIKLASSVTGARIKLLMESTIVANEEKKVGEFWVCLEIYRLQNPFTTRNRQDAVMGGFYRLANGTGSQWYLYDKWGKVYKIKLLTDAQLSSLEDIFQDHDVFTFYENYTRDIDLIKLVFWIGEFTPEDNPKIGIERHTLSMELAEK